MRTHSKKAGRPQLELLLGYRVDVEPHEAMIMCINIASAEVAYYNAMIASPSEDDVVVRPEREVVASTKDYWDIVSLQGPEELNLWIKARHDAMDRLTKYCKLAMDVGIAERQVQAAEKYGEAIARMIEGLLADLKLTKEQRKQAPAIVRRHLALASTARSHELAAHG